jgi:hypothetical protein
MTKDLNQHWIGCRHMQNWPLQSPDLLDEGNMKFLVYERQLDTCEELIHHILYVATCISYQDTPFCSIMYDAVKRSRMYIEAEHLLQQ